MPEVDNNCLIIALLFLVSGKLSNTVNGISFHNSDTQNVP